MNKWLKKEHIIKKTNARLLSDILIGSIAWTILLYFVVTFCNEDIILILNSIKDNNVEVSFSFIMFPIILIAFGLFYFADFSINKK